MDDCFLHYTIISLLLHLTTFNPYLFDLLATFLYTTFIDKEGGYLYGKA